jgi:hypothetical protein
MNRFTTIANSKVTALFMGWTDPNTNLWFPIKKMTWNDGKYYTVYLRGMLAAMDASETHRTLVKAGLAKLDRVKISGDIEVSFRTRIPVNRPFTDTNELERLGLSTDLSSFDPFEYIARSGGYGNDNSEIFAQVDPDRSGIYHFYSGTRYIEGVDPSEYISQLEVGDRLRVEKGSIYHQNLLLGRAAGYINDLVRYHPQAVSLTIAKINHDIYRFGKILCHLQVDGKVYEPFSDPYYQPLVDVLAISK